MNFDLTKPCAQCPFRNDRRGYLHPERVIEITDALLNDQTFQCHKTIHKGAPQHCSGALIFLEANERPNQLMRIMERLGAYDRKKLDMDSPVFTDADEMAEHHGSAS
ncbi:hypothetical protein A6U86_05665 [Rhizobium sp. AC27/96]|uniref:DUF6283 family protein n=1 Tax=Rhizobium sp. AC27/96 TaxID=1841653 RepID=UPI000828C21A|nr:DUF6283 family protein [Rhizobium sp. AC27/96]OCJ12510.1 hypothetical protein A6U86_05665 [Rhizobium sp. AC27/96]